MAVKKKLAKRGVNFEIKSLKEGLTVPEDMQQEDLSVFDVNMNRLGLLERPALPKAAGKTGKKKKGKKKGKKAKK